MNSLFNWWRFPVLVCALLWGGLFFGGALSLVSLIYVKESIPLGLWVLLAFIFLICVLSVSVSIGLVSILAMDLAYSQKRGAGK